MTAVSASRYLAEFSGNGDAPKSPVSNSQKSQLEKAQLLRQQEISDSYNRGAADGRSQAMLELGTSLADQQREVQNAVSHERARWVEMEAEKFKSDLEAGFHLIETRLATITARVLAPILEQEISRKAIEELQKAVAAILRDANGLEVIGTVASDFVAHLANSSLKSGMSNVKILEGDSEIRFRIGDTLVETRMGEWINEIRAKVL